jgi:hypothetical protein
MRRLLLVPVVALALLISSVPASAQESDPLADWSALRHDDVAFKRDLDRFERNRDRCQPVDELEAIRLTDIAYDIATRASDLAPRLATTNHAAALRVHALVQADYLWLTYHGFEAAEQCYVPPAE